MNCLLCPSIAVADCLCVPCGAKAWVANARLTNKAQDLAALDEANPLDETDPLDTERLKARDEIKDIGNALAFEHSLIFAKKTKEARKAQEWAGDE